MTDLRRCQHEDDFNLKLSNNVAADFDLSTKCNQDCDDFSDS